MSTYARRLVSGGKARFKDDELKIDLDLVYVTDRVIIMGYPAEGVEAFYRNSRHDARKFLEHRHGLNYWIFNFCPVTENSYPAEFFRGHVSRYPFPDHHAPPLSIMALATREMDLWLKGDPERIVVLHCKAGKGRSGTLACSYLLSLEEPPSSPRLRRSHTRKEWANKRAEEMMDAVTIISETEGELSVAQSESNPNPTLLEHGGQHDARLNSEEKTGSQADVVEQSSEHLTTNGQTLTTSPQTVSPPSAAQAVDLKRPAKLEPTLSSASLDRVLALHTARRMKPPSKDGSKQPRGVSIPSQRRFLFYWSQMLSNAGPIGFWSIEPASPLSTNTRVPSHRVQIKEIKVRMQDISGTKATAMKMINKVLEKAGRGKVRGSEKGKGDVWVSVARYDDGLVDTLEQWEKHTRDGDRVGRRKPDTEYLDDDDTEGERGIAKLFEDGRWDSSKMVRSFARLGVVSKSDVIESSEEEVRVLTHTLLPLPHSQWIDISKKEDTRKAEPVEEGELLTEDSISTISEKGEANITQKSVDEGSIVVDANREVRMKLYMGQVPMGWFWFIPTFHMQEELSSHPPSKTAHLKFRKSDIDFPLGAGAWILDVDVALEWVTDQYSAPSVSQESVEGPGEPSGGMIAGIGRLNVGGDIGEAVEAAQAVRD